MFCCKTVKCDSVLSQNLKIRHFLLQQNGFRAVSRKKLHALRSEPTPDFMLLCMAKMYPAYTSSKLYKFMSHFASVFSTNHEVQSRHSLQQNLGQYLQSHYITLQAHQLFFFVLTQICAGFQPFKAVLFLKVMFLPFPE